MFVFVTEDGTGMPDATSYVSVSEAADIISMRVDAAPDWEALADAQKEKYLSWASRYLDARVRWKGDRAQPASGLRWPRTCVYDREDILIPDNVIPKQLKEAVTELALYLMDEKPVTGGSSSGLKRFRLDPIELEFTDSARQVAIPGEIQFLIAGLGQARSHYSFGKIRRS